MLRQLHDGTAGGHLGLKIYIAQSFPDTDRGNKNIIVAMDYFSKMVKVYALPISRYCGWRPRQRLDMSLWNPIWNTLRSGQKFCLPVPGRLEYRTTLLNPQSEEMVEWINYQSTPSQSCFWPSMKLGSAIALISRGTQILHTPNYRTQPWKHYIRSKVETFRLPQIRLLTGGTVGRRWQRL